MGITKKLKNFFGLRPKVRFRKTGHYWVKLHYQVGRMDGWHVGFYYEGTETWLVGGLDRKLYDMDFLQINERRIPFFLTDQVVIPATVWWSIAVLFIIGFSFSIYSLIAVILR